METPFIGQIAVFGYNFVPRGWAECDGRLLPISAHQALFALIGTTYGGDGRTNFALPDLRGRAAIMGGAGPGLTSIPVGAIGGQAQVALSHPELPAHKHALLASSETATSTSPAAQVPAAPAPGASPGVAYAATGSALAPATVGGTGGRQPHNNIQPSLALRYCIALQGIFPSFN